MLQYKTTTIPNPIMRGMKKKEFRALENGETSNFANVAIANVGQCIEAEARGGWTLHSLARLPQRIVRKKTIFEFLLGWIPWLGDRLFPTMRTECYGGSDFEMYVLTFVREA